MNAYGEIHSEKTADRRDEMAKKGEGKKKPQTVIREPYIENGEIKVKETIID